MSPPNILLVEDMTEILDYNRCELEKRGYFVTAARTLSEACRRLADRPPDLAVVDILLPDGSGLELCRRLRDTSVPVLLLTCLGDSDQIVQGLAAGGDDYITKPYRIEELAARIEAHLRRVRRIMQSEAETRCGPLLLLSHMRRAFLNGEDLLLKPKEFQLLATLLRNRSRYMTDEELYAAVWGMAPNNALRTVQVHISSLRIKLRQNEAAAVPCVIERSGRSYRLVLPEEDQGGHP